MRVLVSALLLAIFGNKKESKCSTGEELTSSFVPAGLQVINHYLTQVRGSAQDSDVGEVSKKAIPYVSGASAQPGVPTVIVTYEFEGKKESEIVEKLLKLSAVFDEEATEQDLGECRGMTSEVLRQLETSSRMSSCGQLSFILGNIISGVVKSPTRSAFFKEMLTELEDDDSVLSTGLKSVSPLKYLSDLSLE